MVVGPLGTEDLLSARSPGGITAFSAEELILSVCSSLTFTVYGFPAYLEKADKVPHRSGTVDFGARAVLGRIAGLASLAQIRGLLPSPCVGCRVRLGRKV